VRAQAGDVVHVDVVIENKAEGSQTTSAHLLVNGKVVASELFTWGWSPETGCTGCRSPGIPGRSPPVSTGSGSRPTSGRIRPPSDNRLDVTKTLLIVPAGGAFPGGKRREEARRRRIRGSMYPRIGG